MSFSGAARRIQVEGPSPAALAFGAVLFCWLGLSQCVRPASCLLRKSILYCAAEGPGVGRQDQEWLLFLSSALQRAGSSLSQVLGEAHAGFFL
jgi:hypothetical protein